MNWPKIIIVGIMLFIGLTLVALGGLARHLPECSIAPKPVAYAGMGIIICAGLIWVV